ncbi:hypothetical protein [Anaerocellum diazotrophicum]|uniref:Uncharacterized protein n=1 Tax=Caldicellulosiruptor diazotrophicus TaxID=2806205 RepID=A0ABN6E9F8_9FIRM|nr:hypothetical protein [Caldicellulosiruptor diazotrophicus]BCS80231.1 hypothetical protein CaldiYA01_01910 [Caldicellulosiruptor diazotrophicus]
MRRKEYFFEDYIKLDNAHLERFCKRLKNASKQGGIGLSKLLYDSMIKRIENAYKFKEE